MSAPASGRRGQRRPSAYLWRHPHDSVDWRQGYGFQFWMSRHGFHGDSAFGQFCVVLPEQDAVVATTGGTEAMQAVLDHLWAHRLAGFAMRRLDDGAQQDLEKRLAGLKLSHCVAQPTPVGGLDRRAVSGGAGRRGPGGATAHLGRAEEGKPCARCHHRRASQRADLPCRRWGLAAGLRPAIFRATPCPSPR
jgi:hypothetical protein